jgi:hypothetical protein
MLEVLTEPELPDWFRYPPEYLKVVGKNYVDLGTWHLESRAWVLLVKEDVKKRYPSRELVPFARDGASDEIACWEHSKPGKVVVIENFAPPGLEDIAEYHSFWDWFRQGIENLIAYWEGEIEDDRERGGPQEQKG